MRQKTRTSHKPSFGTQRSLTYDLFKHVNLRRGILFSSMYWPFGRLRTRTNVIVVANLFPRVPLTNDGMFKLVTVASRYSWLQASVFGQKLIVFISSNLVKMGHFSGKHIFTGKNLMQRRTKKDSGARAQTPRFGKKICSFRKKCRWSGCWGYFRLKSNFGPLSADFVGCLTTILTVIVTTGYFHVQATGRSLFFALSTVALCRQKAATQLFWELQDSRVFGSEFCAKTPGIQCTAIGKKQWGNMFETAVRFWHISWHVRSPCLIPFWGIKHQL